MINKIAWKILTILFKRKATINNLQPTAILVMLNGQIGDVVQTTPVLKALKGRWSKVVIDYCVYDNSNGGLINNPNIRQIIKANQFGAWSLLKPLPIFRICNKLKKNNYDLAVCLGNDPSYGIVARLADVKSIVGIIDKEYKNVFLDVSITVPYGDNKPRINNYKTLGEKIGLDLNDSILPEIYWTKEDEEYIDGIFKPVKKPIVAVFAGAGPNVFRPWAKRSWPVKNWTELIQKLLIKYPDAGFVLLGRGGDRAVNQEIIFTAKTEKICDLTDKTTYPQLAYALSKCNLLISTDSAPVFAAAAVGCSLIVMYGPEWPERAQPVGVKVWRPVTVDMACRKYCCSFPAKAAVCNNECMANITVDMVYKEARNCFKN